ncbi:MAG: DUF4258 domain-containing protein [Verrucomicrobia bacterium]|nr:DUF4258 domain-containing protein [Verrucomicrobiota bacterium]
MTVLTRIKATVRDGRYEVTDHAKHEAEDDDFAPSDIRHAVLEGALVRRYTSDPRGTRYKLFGPALDGRMMYVVCRFDEFGDIRIVTVYAEEHEG